MKKQKGYAILEVGFVVLVVAICIAAGWGWIANIVKLAGSDFAHITGMLVLRVVGIFVAPLGVVLGFV